MDRTQTSRIAHTHHPIAAPLADLSVRALLERLDPAPDGRVVDLGCGAGEWLLRLLALRPDLTATGVDLHLHPEREVRATDRGVARRITWVEDDAATWADGVHDAVLCVGASHAFGGLDPMLESVRGHLRPGGRCLVGDGVWERPPSAAAQEALGATPQDFPSISGFVETARRHGFGVAYAHTSSTAEWDEYEWSWTGSLTEWALQPVTAPEDRAAALAAAEDHRRGWLEGYRGELGFVSAVLVDAR